MTDPDYPDPDARAVDAAAALLDGAETAADVADRFDVADSTARQWIADLRDLGFSLEYDPVENAYQIAHEDRLREVADLDADTTDDDPFEYANPEDPEADNSEPAYDDLPDRQQYIVDILSGEAVTRAELADDLGVPTEFVDAHLADLRRSGWSIYRDETADTVRIESDRALRSSEHIGTRTRKANRWWELRHNDLVRRFRSLERPTATQTPTDEGQDIVLHLTDIHMGDRVRDDEGRELYNADLAEAVVDYITEKLVELVERHRNRVAIDTIHLLWGGDFVTNSGIYEGQFENLDAWLDEQHDRLTDPLLRQLRAAADLAPTVNVVAQVGNHGQHRASGTSKQANADLILYKSIRNTVAAIREHADGSYLDNVAFQIGDASAFKNFELRGGRLRGHLRHGQNSLEHIGTSSGKRRWRGWLDRHEFDIGWVGHHHRSKRLEVLGRPVFMSGSPKPADDFAEKLGAGDSTGIATIHGVGDDGVTFVYPVDDRDFDR